MRLIPAPITETVVPARLGRSFRWLLAATIVNNAGDGVVLAAGPLLVASQTQDPFLVSMAVLSEYLPVLLFGVLGGATADRFDRKRMVIVVNLVRAFVLAILVATILGDVVGIGVVLVVLFILGTAETFADSASSTLVPGLVQRDDLGTANNRMQGGFLLTNQLVAPPIGAFLFATGMAIPFATNAVCFVLGAVLVSRVVTSSRPVAREGSSLRAEMAEGLRWLLGHPPMRTLALTILAFNITFGAAWSVLVLYADQRLGMGPVGFGLLTTAVAVGGVAGMVLYGRLERRYLPRRHHAGRPDHRDAHAPVAGADDLVRRRPGHAGRVRRACLCLGHHLDRRPAARGAGRPARPGLGRLPGRDRGRPGHRDPAGRTARAARTGSRRRSGSGSSDRRSSWRCCGASSTSSRTRRRTERPA